MGKNTKKIVNSHFDMKVLLNTTFFFAPTIAAEARSALASRWLPACGACGIEPPLCLAMDSEPGVERLAIQTFFATRQSACDFLDRVAAPMADELMARFGPEVFTTFSTIMEVTEL